MTLGQLYEITPNAILYMWDDRITKDSYIDGTKLTRNYNKEIAEIKPTNIAESLDGTQFETLLTGVPAIKVKLAD